MPFPLRLLAAVLVFAPLPVRAQSATETVTVTGDRAHLIETRPNDTALGLDKPLAAQYELVRRHYDDMLTHYGRNPGVRIARKHLGWYSKGLPGSAEFRAAVNQTDEMANVASLLRRFYEPLIDRGTERAVPRDAAGASLDCPRPVIGQNRVAAMAAS